VASVALPNKSNWPKGTDSATASPLSNASKASGVGKAPVIDNLFVSSKLSYADLLGAQHLFRLVSIRLLAIDIGGAVRLARGGKT
jgi:hypothetical protein